MKISISDPRWAIYCAGPNTDSYKGFELKGTIKTKPNLAKITFSDGDKEFEVTANSLEDAFVKGFDKIDSYKK